MAQVRLRINMVINSKFHARGSVLDEGQVPENLRKGDYIDRNLKDRHGRVLLLRDLSFQSLPRPMSDGVAASFPVTLAAGELLDLAQVPASQSLKEGEDYKTDWTFEEQAELQKAVGDIYANSKQYETEPAVPTGWRHK